MRFMGLISWWRIEGKRWKIPTSPTEDNSRCLFFPPIEGNIWKNHKD
jgi:hypothetical protein